MIQAWIWVIIVLLLTGENKLVVAQNYDPKITVVSYGSHASQAGDYTANQARVAHQNVYQEQSLGSAVGQFIQDHVRIKVASPNINNFSQLSYGPLSIERTYPRLSECEFRILFSREIELGLKTPEQVLKLYHLYKYPQFMNYIRSLPGYGDLVLDINTRLHSLMGAQWFLKSSGLSKKSAKILLAARAQEVLREREAQVRAQTAKREQEEVERQRRIAAYRPPESLARCIEKWREQESLEQENSVRGARYKKRLAAVRELAQAGPANTCEYKLSNRSRDLLEQLDVERAIFTQLRGDQLQHVLHTEFIDLIEAVADMQDSCAGSPTARDLTVFLGECIDTGCQANKQGDTAYASKIADFCWAAAEKIGQVMVGAAEGVVQIFESTAHAIMHPLETGHGIKSALNIVIPLFMEMVMVTGDHPSFDVNLNIDTEYGNFKRSLDPERAEQVVKFFDKLAASAQRASCRDMAREATAFIAPLFAGKLCSAAAKCVSAINARMPGVVRLALTGAPEAAEVVALAEGVEIGFAGNALEAFAESELAQARATVLMQEGLQGEKAAAAALESFAPEAKAVRAIEIEQVIASARTPYLDIQNLVIAELRQEIDVLKFACDQKRKGFAECANKYLKIAYEHILGMELKFSRGDVPRIGGFHHDFMRRVENSGVFKFLNKKQMGHGFYSADLYAGENFVKEITFFPADWPREKVVNCIYEAYDNFVEKGCAFEALGNGKYKVEALTKQGIKIEMYVTKNGLIASAYPTF